MFIKENIYHLKQEYGFPLQIGNQIIVSQDTVSGKQVVVNSQKYIAKAIRLPNQLSFNFLAKLGIGNTSGLAIYAGSFQILIDKDDLGTIVPEVSKTWAIYDGKRVDIKVVEDLPDAYILLVVELRGFRLPISELTDSIVLGESYASQLN